RESLRRHLRLSKPAIIHLVATSEVPPIEHPAAIHYFQGDEAAARRYLDAGYLISVGKPVLRLTRVQEAARIVPRDRLLVETDTYPLAGRSTEPAHARLVAEGLAAARGEEPDAIIEATWINLLTFLGCSVREPG
ncbi:MAG: TatD family hydrolase, partial [Chloroflexota bacterium]